jgi:hypothetical protein
VPVRRSGGGPARRTAGEHKDSSSGGKTEMAGGDVRRRPI